MKIPKAELNARLTLLDSAQAFHWTEQDGCFAAVCGGKSIALRPDGEDWQIDGDDETVRQYFDLDAEYRNLCAGFDWLPQAKQAVELLPGLRLLRQEKYNRLLRQLQLKNAVRQLKRRIKRFLLR